MIRSTLRTLRDAPTLRRRAETAEIAAAEAGRVMRGAQANANAWSLAVAAGNRRLAHAPTPETAIVGCWTLGGSDAALARAAGETEEGILLMYPPVRTLADLGAMDAVEFREARGCGRETMRRAARTLALAGVDAHPSWARWLR